jgi:hypothetical protein
LHLVSKLRMIFKADRYSIFALFVSSLSLLSCGKSTTTNEKTTFTKADSLTETYLSIQDTLLQSWNVMIKDEQETIIAMENALDHFSKLHATHNEHVNALRGRLEQLKRLSITQKTLTNQDVLAEYDFASSSLVSEILSVSDANPSLLQNTVLSEWIDKIKIVNERKADCRMGYDSIALEFNDFVEKNMPYLKDLKDENLTKRPLFSVASDKQ